MLARRGDQERAIAPFDKAHHPYEADVDLARGMGRGKRISDCRTGGGAAERNSTNKIATIHL
jgi:hypothetical protein